MSRTISYGNCLSWLLGSIETSPVASIPTLANEFSYNLKSYTSPTIFQVGSSPSVWYSNKRVESDNLIFCSVGSSNCSAGW